MKVLISMKLKYIPLLFRTKGINLATGFLLLYNEEKGRPVSFAELEKRFQVTSNTLYTILNKQSYKDFTFKIYGRIFCCVDL